MKRISAVYYIGNPPKLEMLFNLCNFVNRTGHLEIFFLLIFFLIENVVLCVYYVSNVEKFRQKIKLKCPVHFAKLNKLYNVSSFGGLPVYIYIYNHKPMLFG